MDAEVAGRRKKERGIANYVHNESAFKGVEVQ